MARRLLIVFLSVSLSACSPQKQFNRLISKNSWLLDDFILSQRDTVILPAVKFDTIFKTKGDRDTFFISKTFTTITTAPGEIIVRTDKPADTTTAQKYYYLPAPKGEEPNKLIYIALSVLTILVLFLIGFISGQKKHL